MEPDLVVNKRPDDAVSISEPLQGVPSTLVGPEVTLSTVLLPADSTLAGTQAAASPTVTQIPTQAVTTPPVTVVPANLDTSQCYCSVCGNGDSWEDNPICICDGCYFATHASCYGITKEEIDAPTWLCRSCKMAIPKVLPSGEPNPELRCKVCHRWGGMLMSCAGGGWIHKCCAIFIPDIFVKDEVADITAVKKARRTLKCCICHERNGGACVQCHADHCYASFHVWCAIDRHLFTEVLPYPDDTIEFFNAVYCDVHEQAMKARTDAQKYPYMTQGCLAVALAKSSCCPRNATELWSRKEELHKQGVTFPRPAPDGGAVAAAAEAEPEKKKRGRRKKAHVTDEEQAVEQAPAASLQEGGPTASASPTPVAATGRPGRKSSAARPASGSESVTGTSEPGQADGSEMDEEFDEPEEDDEDEFNEEDEDDEGTRRKPSRRRGHKKPRIRAEPKAKPEDKPEDPAAKPARRRPRKKKDDPKEAHPKEATGSEQGVAPAATAAAPSPSSQAAPSSAPTDGAAAKRLRVEDDDNDADNGGTGKAEPATAPKAKPKAKPRGARKAAAHPPPQTPRPEQPLLPLAATTTSPFHALPAPAPSSSGTLSPGLRTPGQGTYTHALLPPTVSLLPSTLTAVPPMGLSPAPPPMGMSPGMPMGMSPAPPPMGMSPGMPMGAVPMQMSIYQMAQAPQGAQLYESLRQQAYSMSMSPAAPQPQPQQLPPQMIFGYSVQ
ncbi:putative bromodomain and PHD finger-containing protein 1 [Paratrimastix pyriformis]|uniref:Bromodomain and PHD finger-containing protein 1 n=1 Tax=Paratrimastix pyriformis TaxID=342808 RepID=A0ABQ8UI98_9EUKA|nr:putative bromodomain and PHD finger-containing protein 1 [Paratrimastix pyriformis]